MPRPLADTINAACSDPTRFVFGGDPSDDNARRVLGSKVRAMMRQAHRFFIDDEVTHAACTLGVQHPDILRQIVVAGAYAVSLSVAGMVCSGPGRSGRRGIV